MPIMLTCIIYQILNLTYNKTLKLQESKPYIYSLTIARNRQEIICNHFITDTPYITPAKAKTIGTAVLKVLRKTTQSVLQSLFGKLMAFLTKCVSNSTCSSLPKLLAFDVTLHRLEFSSSNR